MTTARPNACRSCRWLTDHVLETCEAYPAGIPEEIWGGEVGHFEPRGDEWEGKIHETESGKEKWLAGFLLVSQPQGSTT